MIAERSEAVINLRHSVRTWEAMDETAIRAGFAAARR